MVAPEVQGGATAATEKAAEQAVARMGRQQHSEAVVHYRHQACQHQQCLLLQKLVPPLVQACCRWRWQQSRRHRPRDQYRLPHQQSYRGPLHPSREWRAEHYRPLRRCRRPTPEDCKLRESRQSSGVSQHMHGNDATVSTIFYLRRARFRSQWPYSL